MTRKISAFVSLAMTLAAPVWAATDPVPPIALGKSVHREFGGIRHDYFFPGRVSDQINLGQSIPNPPKLLPEGNTLISGCRVHSCDEKTAVIATGAGVMLAAGMIYLRCVPEKVERAQGCKMVTHLRIFLKQKNNRPDFVQELKEWAARVGYKGGDAEMQILPGN